MRTVSFLGWVLIPGLTWGLKGPPEVIGYLGQPLSIECQYDKFFRTYRKYWCKGSDWRYCHIVVQTDGTEAQVKAGRTSVKDNQTRSEFTVRLENLSQEDAGIYWCGIKRIRKDPGFQIHVTVLPGLTWGLNSPPEVTGYLGQLLSLECQYNKYFRTHRKYWCKGSDWSSCHIVVQTDGTEAQVKAGRTSIKDNQMNSQFTVRLVNISQKDAGIYWCGIERYGIDPGVCIYVLALPDAVSDSTKTLLTMGQSGTYSSAKATCAAQHPVFVSFLISIGLKTATLLCLVLGIIWLHRSNKQPLKKRPE